MGLQQPWVRGILGTDAQTWIFGVINSGYFFASPLGGGLINLLGGIAEFVAFSLMVKSIRISGVWTLSGIVFGASGMLYLLMKESNPAGAPGQNRL